MRSSEAMLYHVVSLTLVPFTKLKGRFLMLRLKDMMPPPCSSSSLKSYESVWDQRGALLFHDHLISCCISHSRAFYKVKRTSFDSTIEGYDASSM